MGDIKDDKCHCGAESEVGVHGVKENDIYDEYYCYECWNKHKKGKTE